MKKKSPSKKKLAVVPPVKKDEAAESTTTPAAETRGDTPGPHDEDEGEDGEVEDMEVAAAAPPEKTTAEKLAEIRLRKESLELEDLTYKVENEQNRRSERRQQMQTQQRSILDAQRQQKAVQDACPHRKGGKDMGGLSRGTDTKYSVNTSTTPWGQQYVMCTRCGKEVWGPFNGKPADPEFAAWLQLPTDNEPSGTQIFLVYPPKPPGAESTLSVVKT